MSAQATAVASKALKLMQDLCHLELGDAETSSSSFYTGICASAAKIKGRRGMHVPELMLFKVELIAIRDFPNTAKHSKTQPDTVWQ
jgi:hypothetical protein